MLGDRRTTKQGGRLRRRGRPGGASLDRGTGPAPGRAGAPANLKTSTDVFVEVLDQSWSVVYSTGQLNGAPPPIAPTLRAKASEVSGGAFDTENGVRLYAIPFNGGFVVTGQSTRVVQSNVSGVLGFLVISGVPTLLAALAASWLVAGRALKPLKDVAGTADEIGRAPDFGRRLPTRRSPDEGQVHATSDKRLL